MDIGLSVFVKSELLEAGNQAGIWWSVAQTSSVYVDYADHSDSRTHIFFCLLGGHWVTYMNFLEAEQGVIS